MHYLQNITRSTFTEITRNTKRKWPFNLINYNIKPKAKSLKCFSLAVPLPEMLREFLLARRNRLGEKVTQMSHLSHFSDFCLGHTFRPGPRDPKRMTEA